MIRVVDVGAVVVVVRCAFRSVLRRVVVVGGGERTKNGAMATVYGGGDERSNERKSNVNVMMRGKTKEGGSIEMKDNSSKGEQHDGRTESMAVANRSAVPLSSQSADAPAAV